MASQVSFSKVQYRLEEHGSTRSRIRGSHIVFARPGELPMSIPVHGRKVKAVYVKKVEQICKTHEQEPDD